MKIGVEQVNDSPVVSDEGVAPVHLDSEYSLWLLPWLRAIIPEK